MPLPTVRIPELPALTGGLALALSDKLPIYIASENKTKRVDLQTLNTFFNTGGGGGSHPPVVYGGEMVYRVPSAAAGTQIAPISTLAGKDFTLERGGYPLIALLPDNSNVAIAEYKVLDAGGFQLLQAGDTLVLDERFKLTIFSLISGGGTTTASFINGKKIITANTTLNPTTDVNKMIQVRGVGIAIILTIPSIGDIPVNSFFPIESSINNTKPCTIQTTSSQLIYFNGSGKSTIYLMPGEVCWLWRDDDGLYVINDFNQIYRRLAQPIAAFKAELNQLVCKGQLVLRADYPRLWEFVQTLGASLVTDAVWNTANVYRQGNTYSLTPPGGSYITIPRPYRGCFSSGNGTTDFRLPDLMNMSLRGVKTESGTDDERYLNKPGGFQDDMLGEHYHITNFGNNSSNQDGSGKMTVGGQAPEGTPPVYKSGGVVDAFDLAIGAVETRVENVGMLWVINS